MQELRYVCLCINRYWEALQKTLKEEEKDDLELGPEEQVPDWIRCSAADLYFKKDVKVQ